MQRVLRRLSPVHFYYPHYKLRDRSMYYDWATLDTHDACTDVFKHHRSPKQIKRLLEDIDAFDIVVEAGGNGVEAFCRKRLETGGSSDPGKLTDISAKVTK